MGRHLSWTERWGTKARAELLFLRTNIDPIASQLSLPPTPNLSLFLARDLSMAVQFRYGNIQFTFLFNKFNFTNPY